MMYLIPELESLPIGSIRDLDEGRREIFEKFKAICIEEKLFDVGKHDPSALLRFLKARNFKIEQAKKMWTSTLAWRRDNEIDDIIENFVFTEGREVKKYYMQFYHKVDKLGRPVYYEYLGSIDVKKLNKITKPERMIRNHIYEYEKLLRIKLPAASLSIGKRIEQSCTVLNLKGVHISDFGSVYSLVKSISGISQDHYPEILGRMFIINSPMLFTATWNLIKGILDESTVKKISIHGSDYLNHVTRLIPIENLPASIGGKCNCPGGCEYSDSGPWIEK